MNLADVIPAYVARVGAPASMDIYLKELAVLTKCRTLGQFREGPGPSDFVAWLLVDPWQMGQIIQGKLVELVTEQHDSLRRGPFLYIVDLQSSSPGWAFSVIRELCRFPGVIALAGHRFTKGGALRYRRTRGTRRTPATA